jgi:hypothetical protein
MAYIECLSGSGGGGGTGVSLVVTCDSQFAGKTITCSSGATSYTQRCSSTSPYQAVFVGVPEGTWTVSGVLGETTLSTSITITSLTCNLQTLSLVPNMTSNTTPFGKVSFKGGEYSPNNAAWKAFDGTIGHTNSTVAFSALTYQSDDYLQYEFDIPVFITSGIINWYSAETVPKTLMIDISSDGTNYTEVYRSSIASDTLEHTFELASPVLATYIRAHQIDGRWGGGDQRMSVDRLQVYGYEDV